MIPWFLAFVTDEGRYSLPDIAVPLQKIPLEENNAYPVTRNIEDSFRHLKSGNVICKLESEAQDPMVVAFVSRFERADLRVGEVIIPGDFVVECALCFPWFQEWCLEDFQEARALPFSWQKSHRLSALQIVSLRGKRNPVRPPAGAKLMSAIRIIVSKIQALMMS